MDWNIICTYLGIVQEEMEGRNWDIYQLSKDDYYTGTFKTFFFTFFFSLI